MIKACGSALTWFKLEGWRVEIARRADFEVGAKLDDSALLGGLESTETEHQEMRLLLIITNCIGNCRDLTMVRLVQVALHMAGFSPYVRSSYAEISRFVRARHHGITLCAPVACSKNSHRAFSTVNQPDPKTKEVLDNYRTSCKEFPLSGPFSPGVNFQ